MDVLTFKDKNTRVDSELTESCLMLLDVAWRIFGVHGVLAFALQDPAQTAMVHATIEWPPSHPGSHQVGRCAKVSRRNAATLRLPLRV